jgi:outer membrane protein OmpA-like peptidoglycan-associated protein
LSVVASAVVANAAAQDDDDAEVQRILRELGASTGSGTTRGFGVGARPAGSVEFQTITFAFDSATLTGEATAVLDVIARALANQALANARILIEGHTDARGDDAYNLTLSQRRAESVRQYLIETSEIDADRLQVEGKGESEPIDPSRPEAASNRRVRFVRLN